MSEATQCVEMPAEALPFRIEAITRQVQCKMPSAFIKAKVLESMKKFTKYLPILAFNVNDVNDVLKTAGDLLKTRNKKNHNTQHHVCLGYYGAPFIVHTKLSIEFKEWYLVMIMRQFLFNS
jgi:hypothetical protein